MFQTPVRTLLLIGLALLVFVFLLSLNWLLNEENGLKVQTIESDFVENDINNSEDFSNKFNDNGVDDDVKQSTDDVEFAFRGDQFRKHKNVDVAPNRVSWFETNNVAFLVFPSMLGPETIDVARERASAVQTTWAASIPRDRVFYLQWFEGGDVIGDTEQLLRVPSEFNQTFVTRVFWGVSEIQKKLKPNWIVKGDDVTYFLTKNLIRLLDDEQLDIHKPLVMGHLLQGPGMERPFLSGGAGYAMSQAVVELFSKLILEQDPCVQSEGGAEDVTVATCLSRHYEVNLDDESMRTDAIFHAFCPLTLLRLKGGVYNFPVEWYESYRKPFGGVITGKECCDPFTVSFHYVLPAQMRALHFTLHNRRVPPPADSVYFEPYYQQRDVLEPFLLQHIV